MRERRRPDLRLRRQLLDPRRSEPREVVGRSLERRKGWTARLVRQGDRALGATGKRLQERPLRARQVLEAVGEDGAALPRAELAGEPPCGGAALEVPVPEAETVELGPIPGIEPREITDARIA